MASSAIFRTPPALSFLATYSNGMVDGWMVAGRKASNGHTTVYAMT